MGGVRKSKDVDCSASTSKEQPIQLLDYKEGFVVIPQSRTDYVAFMWSDQPGTQNAVLAEIFCEEYFLTKQRTLSDNHIDNQIDNQIDNHIDNRIHHHIDNHIDHHFDNHFDDNIPVSIYLGEK
ncbi:hypothetical protein C8A00DRAFT_37211 [Chaetomidium leptoderma]|uniref:Uncharacterized protein n=1 Tax=Chaetomidium leptoderma TaxID=669021 RepID=A0AAN6VG65_9PEZI|nr:hypothetical protein C8A00DRAFT_37211 [Chaetomidium leptoderma]